MIVSPAPAPFSVHRNVTGAEFVPGARAAAAGLKLSSNAPPATNARNTAGAKCRFVQPQCMKTSRSRHRRQLSKIWRGPAGLGYSHFWTDLEAGALFRSFPTVG